MSHWAEIDKNDIVIRVLVCDNNDPNGDEGYRWLVDNLGGTWVKTSYNAQTNKFRKNFAGIGYTWDRDLDAFIPPKPYPSWILDKDLCIWITPIPFPNDGNKYLWNEESMSWIMI